MDKRWRVLMGCFIGMSVATPAILMVPIGLFLKPITAEFGWSRTQFSSVVAIATVFYALVMPCAGYLVDRFGAPRIIALGTTLGCCGYAALSLAHSYFGFIAMMAFAVTFGNLASYPAFIGLAQRWFDKRLGLALAITSTGQAVGVGIFSFMIVKSIELRGWRTAFLIVGSAALIIGLVNLVALVRDNRGPVPAEERRHITVDAAPELGVGSLMEAVRTTEFWLFSLSFLLIIFAVVGGNIHLPALLSDRGASTVQIAAIVGIGSFGSLFGRFFTGIMLDRYSVRLVAAFFFAGQALGFLLLLTGLRWALPASFLLGAVQGAEIDLLGYVVARRFGRLAYAKIFGACFAVTLAGAIAGPLAMAAIFDRTGSYNLGIALLPMFPIVAFVLLYFATVRRPVGEIAAPIGS